MMNRRPPQQIYRKYPLPATGDNIRENTVIINDTSSVNESVKIPLPNQFEHTSNFSEGLRFGGFPSFLNIFNNKMYIDEIILIGLIFVLMQEGVDDELLIVLLVFILLAGRE